MTTSTDYSPWSLLPSPEPRTVSPPLGQFYDTVSKHLIKDCVRIMHNGLPIDLQKVRELEQTLDTVISGVHATLESNPIVQAYQSDRHSRLATEYRNERLSMCRDKTYYHKPFKPKDMNHRSYYMHIFGLTHDISYPTDLLPTGRPKWTSKAVSIVASRYPALNSLIDGTVSPTSPTAVAAMELLAQDKADIYNRKFIDQAKELATFDYPPFNPGSGDQNNVILHDMLGYTSDKDTDSWKKYEREFKAHQKWGKPCPIKPKRRYSWDRDNIEALLRATDDPVEQELFQALIDYSFGAIIKSTFVPAFYEHTIDGRLHGTLVLFGTKTFRLTSKAPFK